MLIRICLWRILSPFDCMWFDFRVHLGTTEFYHCPYVWLVSSGPLPIRVTWVGLWGESILCICGTPSFDNRDFFSWGGVIPFILYFLVYQSRVEVWLSQGYMCYVSCHLYRDCWPSLSHVHVMGLGYWVSLPLFPREWWKNGWRSKILSSLL